MVSFLSVFLGLVAGVQPVGIAVGGAVVAVEIRLDGCSVGSLRDAPWTLACDFGSELAPHLLVAIGRDADGRELARAEQWINLPRPRSQVELVLEEDPQGPPLALGGPLPAGLRSLLDRQLMVWLEGHHLPQEIALSPAGAAQLRLLGDAPAELPGGEPEIETWTAEDQPEAVPVPAVPEPAGSMPVTDPASGFVDTVEVHVVNVEVVVSDREGRRIRDLARDELRALRRRPGMEITHFLAPPAVVPSGDSGEEIAGGFHRFGKRPDRSDASRRGGDFVPPGRLEAGAPSTTSNVGCLLFPFVSSETDIKEKLE